jgi:hypothetical protein
VPAVSSDRSNRFAALAAVMYRLLSKRSFAIAAVKKRRPEHIPMDPGHRGYSPTPPRLWPLIRCFRIADGVNTITRRGEFGTSEPVFGLRPIRRPFLSFLVMAFFPCSFRIADHREMRLAASECEPGFRIRLQKTYVCGV